MMIGLLMKNSGSYNPFHSLRWNQQTNSFHSFSNAIHFTSINCFNWLRSELIASLLSFITFIVCFNHLISWNGMKRNGLNEQCYYNSNCGFELCLCFILLVYCYNNHSVNSINQFHWLTEWTSWINLIYCASAVNWFMNEWM